MGDSETTQPLLDNLEAFNEGDWDKFTRSIAADAVYEELATGQRMDGPEPWLASTKGWKEALPDAKGEVTNLFSSGNKVTAEVTWTGTHTGPLHGPQGTIPPSGKSIETRAVIVAEVDGGKLKTCRHYFDLMSLLSQIGAM